MRPQITLTSIISLLIIFIVASITINSSYSVAVPSDQFTLTSTDKDSLYQFNQIPDSTIFETGLNQVEEPFYLKVLTYNLFFSGVNFEWQDAVIEENADVVVLQETGKLATSTENPEFLEALNYMNDGLEELGLTPYEHYDVSKEPLTDTGGAILLSRYPITFFEQIMELPLDNGTMRNLHHDWLHGVVSANDLGIHIFSNHFACCGLETSIQYNKWDMEATINFMDTLGDVPILLTGDLNSVSEVDIGLEPILDFNLGFDPINMLIDPDHPKGSDIHTWVDTYRELNPYEPGATYVDDTFHSRIDYIFSNQHFTKNMLVNSTVADVPNGFHGVGSDHGTLDTTFNLNPDVDVRPPHAPGNIIAKVISDTSFEISWDEVSDSDLASYQFFKNGVLLDTLNAGETTYTDNDVQAEVRYEYYLTATDTIGNTGLKSRTVTIDSDYGMYGVPKAPVLTGESRDDGIFLSWSLDDFGGHEFLEYRIFRATEDSFLEDRFLIKQKTTSTNWLDKNFSPGNTYYYRVIAVNNLGEYIDRNGYGEKSNTVEILTGDSSGKSDDGGLSFPFVSGFTFFVLVVLSYKFKKIRFRNYHS